MSGNASINRTHEISLSTVGHLHEITEIPIHNTLPSINKEGKMTSSLKLLTTDTIVLIISLFIYLLCCGLLFT